MDEDGATGPARTVLVDAVVIEKFLLLGNCVAHPSVMVRKTFYEKAGPYQLEAKHVEDYELWTRVPQSTRIAALPDALLDYRIHDQKVTTIFNAEKNLNAVKISDRNWKQARKTGPGLFRAFMIGYKIPGRIGGKLSGQQDPERFVDYHLAALIFVAMAALKKGEVKVFVITVLLAKGFFIASPGSLISIASGLVKAVFSAKSISKGIEAFRQDLTTISR